LEWLEQGRCLVWTQLNHLRTPIDNLAQHSPDLAQHFVDVSGRLECAAVRGSLEQCGMSLSDKISLEKQAHTHLKLAKEWHDLLHTIRTTLPGFHNFLQPSPCSALIQNLPDSGPIVIVNVHHSRCDAIALIGGVDEPLHIQLPRFSWKRAKTYQQDFMTYLEEHQLRMQRAELDPLEDQQERGIKPHIKKIHDVLQGLWKDVVKPILEALSFYVSESYLTSCLFYSDNLDRLPNPHPMQSYQGFGGAQLALWLFFLFMQQEFMVKIQVTLKAFWIMLFHPTLQLSHLLQTESKTTLQLMQVSLVYS
jgi:hypothetical protein